MSKKKRKNKMQEALLSEYENSLANFLQSEAKIWQTASFFILISLGGITVLFTFSEHTWPNFLAVATLGIISIFILCLWYGIVNRWLSIESVLLFRMREIESELDMWTQRYIIYLDETRIYKKKVDYTEKNKKRFANLDKGIPHYARTPARRRIRFLIVGLIFGWMVLIARELLLTISNF